jgi:glycosidase
MEENAKGDSSLRRLLPNRWWEMVAGWKVMTLKMGRSYGFELSLDGDELVAQLDEIVHQGFQVIEIFAPARGLYAYSGLDTTDFYAIDPELGTMDDFRRLVRLAHSKGLAIVIFLNIGYVSVEAPDWLKACRDPESEQARWFSWADDPGAPPPGREDSYFFVDTPPPGDADDREETSTWGWQYSELAGRYYWARWKATSESGGAVGLPQVDWSAGTWPEEAARIVRFWMDTGIDGMLIDAPLFYTGLTWGKSRRSIADIISSYGNTYLQPEGGRGIAWVTEGQYNSLQNYGIRLWGGQWQQSAIDYALATGDPSPIEEALGNYHDPIEAVGAVLYHNVGRRPEDPEQRHLKIAATAAAGDVLAYARAWGDPDDEETRILKLRRAHPALYPLGRRRRLPTNADGKYYAFVRSAPDGSERILVVLSFQPQAQAVQVDTSGLYAQGFVGLHDGTFIGFQNPLRVELGPYGYRFLHIIRA